MRKAFLVLLVVLSVASVAFAQLDAARTNLQTGRLGDATQDYSQYVYIHVTMAGVVFEISNQDWVIGDATVSPAWYAFPRNTYISANGSWGGVYPPSYVNTGVAPYNGTFSTDNPHLWNQGGVSLDFFLAISNMGGWKYDSRHVNNRLTDAQVATTEAATGPVFKNAFQLRAHFVNYYTANTGAYASAAARFGFPTASNWLTGFPGVTPGASVNNADIVLTTGVYDGAVDVTDDYAPATNPGSGRSWTEATSHRFNPNGGAAGDWIATQTHRGLGIPPDGKCTIVMSLMTPREITAAYRNLLQVERIIKLRVYGTPSDARD